VPFGEKPQRSHLVFATGSRVGLQKGFNETGAVLTDRFYAGGGTTVRGFRQDELGPRLANGQPAGGVSGHRHPTSYSSGFHRAGQRHAASQRDTNDHRIANQHGRSAYGHGGGHADQARANPDLSAAVDSDTQAGGHYGAAAQPHACAGGADRHDRGRGDRYTGACAGQL